MSGEPVASSDVDVHVVVNFLQTPSVIRVDTFSQRVRIHPIYSVEKERSLGVWLLISSHVLASVKSEMVAELRCSQVFRIFLKP